MAIRNPKLLPSATITLVAPAGTARNVPVTSARAQILSRRAETCPGTRSDADIDSYNLVLTAGSVEPNVPLIALEARVPSVLAAHSFHACNSNTGTQLTAWDGAKPLEGRRLWHQYYDLAEKLDANCTATETAPY